jgi:hypothetical protein
MNNTSKYNYLKVPYGKKDLAKSLGALWSFKKNLWYIPKGIDLGKYKNWIIEDES